MKRSIVIIVVVCILVIVFFVWASGYHTGHFEPFYDTGVTPVQQHYQHMTPCQSNDTISLTPSPEPSPFTFPCR